MRLRSLARVLFIVYCVEAGALLLLVPWGSGWEGIVSRLPLGSLGPLLLHPLARSAVTGFGLVHLVWGAHDLELLVSAWRARGRASG